MGLRKLFFKIYKFYKLNIIEFYNFLFGFEYVNSKLQSIDKRIVIPILKKYGAIIGKNCDIEVPLIINTEKNYEKLIIGDHCHIGKGVILDILGGIELGNNVTISFGTAIVSHIDVGKSCLKKNYYTNYSKTIIRDDVYIGASATVLNGVELRECCLVGGGSVVTGSFPSNSLILGVPAKLIKEIDK